jgi:hypothetical protein
VNLWVMNSSIGNLLELIIRMACSIADLRGPRRLQLLEHDLVDQRAVEGEIAFWTESTIFGREVSKATGCFFFPARTPVVDY